LRKQRKEDLERHVSEVNQLLRKANGEPSEAEDTSEEANGEEDEFKGFDDTVQDPEFIDREDEYIDEERFTTVTIESVGIDKSGFTKEDNAGGYMGNLVVGKDGEEKRNAKRVWTKEKPTIDRPKKRKKKFRYESKAERKAERVKIKTKKKVKAEARKGK
jgi:ribosomal RNA-processing protein 17